MIEFCNFENFRNKHLGETVFFFGSGPTLRKFDLSHAKNAKRVGVNETIFFDSNLDYFFTGDAADPKFYSKIDEFNKFEAKLGKFVGVDQRDDLNIPKRIPGSVHNSLHYHTKLRAEFTTDPTVEDVARWGSISFDVMQILPFMGFRKIYLVGHDCDYSDGTFYTKFGSGPGERDKLLDHWKKIKIFLDKSYPDLEVLSVNPVALTIFRDATREIEERSEDF
jgi:hypothetical protein